MKFKVSTFSDAGLVSDRPVNWIKDFRDQTGCGLKEAKDICDWLRSEIGHRRATHMVLDTDKMPCFSHLNNNLLVEMGTKLICRIKESVSNPKLPRPAATVALERTANRLIKLGQYKKARAVLKILDKAD